MDSFKGTSSTQDIRFGDKEKKLLRTMKFPPSFNQKVDMRKVELSVMKPWIAKKCLDLLGFEDEVVIEYVAGLLEDEANPIVDAKKMMISLLGFLDKQTEPFMIELWSLLLSAQESPVKVPAVFIEQKKEEMRRRQEEKARLDELALIRTQTEERKQREVDAVRQRERGGRERDQRAAGGAPGGYGRSNGSRFDNNANGRGGSQGRDTYQPRREDRPPPPQRRRYDDNDDEERYHRRRPTPPMRARERSRSRSRSPPRRRRAESPAAGAPQRSSRGRDTTPKGDDGKGKRATRLQSRSRSTSRSRSRSRSSSPPRRRRSDHRDDRRGAGRPEGRDESRRQRSPSRSRSRSRERTSDRKTERERAPDSDEQNTKEDDLKARLKARRAD